MAGQAPAQGAGGPPQQGRTWTRTIIEVVAIWFVLQLFVRPGRKAATTGGDDTAAVPVLDDTGAVVATTHRALTNCFEDGEALDAFLYASVHSDPLERFDEPGTALLWSAEALMYDWEHEDGNSRNETVTVEFPPSVLNNGTYYAHFVVAKAGYTTDRTSKEYDPQAVASLVIPLIKHRVKKAEASTRRLLGDDGVAADASVADSQGVGTQAGGEEEAQDSNDDRREDTVVSYFVPAVDLNLVIDRTVLPNPPPPDIADDMVLNAETGVYWPFLYNNDWYMLTEHQVPVNDSTPSLPLQVTFAPKTLLRYRLMRSMAKSFTMQAGMLGSTGGDDAALDEIRLMMVETNPYLLGLLMVITILHMVFDMLAFKNDVSFWRKSKSMVGLSNRTIAINCVVQTVILLYLWDNGANTMVLFSSTLGLVIEVWKLRKAFNLTLRWSDGRPRLVLLDTARAEAEGDSMKQTKAYDAIAMQHLGWALYPLVVGYSIFSLVHQEHKSWYSWILSSLTGFVYVFGFVLMTPQLFINYKLKSVAHMPWRAMVYKSLSTVIDDIFAFVVRMPTLHRVSCFRDDIIFVIFLYQRFIYPVDSSRRNEFGTSADDVAEALARKAAAASGQPVGASTDADPGRESGQLKDTRDPDDEGLRPLTPLSDEDEATTTTSTAPTVSMGASRLTSRRGKR